MKFVLFLFIIFILAIFSPWFKTLPLTGGDWIYLFPQAIKEVIPFSAWDLTFNGVGQSTIPTLWHQSYSFLALKIGSFLPWVLYERIFYFYPFLIFSTVSSYILGFYVLKNRRLALLSSFLYTVNTYSLTLVSGGQMGVALAYSFMPFVVLSYLKLTEQISFRNSLICGLLLSILIVYDLRIAYVSQILISLLFVWELFRKKINLLSVMYFFIIPLGLTFFLHLFWILPIILTRQNPIGQFAEIYSNQGAVKYFSFASFENSLGWLHPNWPDNVFGKVSFMKPEFIILPILAYGFLWFKKRERLILFFALVGLIGSFLAKGANDPFGGIYLFLFSHVPGFVLFRDPTKWYALISVSYSLLIPYSVWQIYSLVKFKKIFLIALALYLVLIMQPALFGDLPGTFKPSNVPEEYSKLSEFIGNDNNFYRTLWVPMVERYGFYSNSHPGINAFDFFKTSDLPQVIKKLKDPKTEELLRNYSIKYVILPDDVKGELFLSDRKYSDKLYKKNLKDLEKFGWFKVEKNFGKIALFEVPDFRDHFYFEDGSSLIYKKFSNSDYDLKINEGTKGEVLSFSDNYDPGWKASDGNNLISSKKSINGTNSFSLVKQGNYDLKVFYQPQEYVYDSLKVSSIALALVLAFLVITRRKEYNTPHD